ncbi:MAG: HPP family protein, partial [bacterium]
MTKIKISEIMETDIPRLKTGNTLLEIAEIFKSSGYTVLPVYDESGRFVGFITLWNIMKIFIPPYFALFKRLDIPTNFGVIEKT